MAELQFEYGFGLRGAKVEALHELAFGFVVMTNDGDDFVDIEEGYEQAG